MSGRNYLSGAQKRKLAEEKKQKLDEQLKKIPRITQMFSVAGPSTVVSNIVTTEIDIEKQNRSENLEEIDETCGESVNLSIDDDNFDELFSNVSASSFAHESEQFSLPQFRFPTDVALWDIHTDLPALQRYWAKLGSKDCQNFDRQFQASPTGRRFSTFHLRRELADGSKVERDWLVFSPSTESIFCFVCRLFGDHSSNDTNVFAAVGFNDWKHSGRSIKSHEHSKSHVENYLAYRRRAKQLESIDDSFKSSVETEMDYWRDILKRIVSVVKFLGSRGLPFRGSNQTIGSNQNGNYLGILELMSEYDSLLKLHLAQYGNKGKGRASYLSADICNEFIFLIAKKIENQIIDEIHKAKYFSLSVDSTPDVSHMDQLVFCVRYVKNEEPVERFLSFIPIEDHTSKHLKDTLVKFLDVKDLNIMHCRGQSYDNAKNMSGVYGGLQAKITEINKLAIFVPCAAHSLNLVGKNAIEGDAEANEFFDLMESLYGFFVYSPSRWNKLKDALSSTGEHLLKRATGTRWSAKHNAVVAVDSSYGKIVALLKSFLDEDQLQSESNKATATGLINKLCQFKNILMLKIWKIILGQFNRVNQKLQRKDLNLSVATKLYKSLIAFLEKFHEQFDTIFNDALNLFEELSNFQSGMMQTRSTSNSNSPGENKKIHKDKFLSIVQSLLPNLQTRSSAYSGLEEKFAFLVDLNNLNNDEISESCKKVAAFYSNDLNENELIEECLIAKDYFNFDKSTFSYSSIYSKILEDGLVCIMPNIETLLRIYLSLFCTNVKDERSFSKLKYIKNYLRSSMGEEKLNAFALLSIEHEVLNNLNFDEIIDDFIHAKNRKKAISTTLSSRASSVV